MYKILILYNVEHNLWQQYGTTTSSLSGKKSTFTEFATDDVEVLKAELLKLDSMYGFENLKVIQDVTTNYTVDIIINEHSSEDTENSEDVSPDDEEDV